MVGKSCYNDISEYLDEHKHGEPIARVEFCAGTQVFCICRTCGIVQTADEINAGNCWRVADLEEAKT